MNERRQHVALVTVDGGLVGYSSIEARRHPPDVVIWGERLFRPATLEEAVRSDHDGAAWLYVEAVSAWLSAPLTQRRVD